MWFFRFSVFANARFVLFFGIRKGSMQNGSTYAFFDLIIIQVTPVIIQLRLIFASIIKKLSPKIIGRQFVWRLFEDYLRDCEVRPAYNYQSLEYTNLVLNRYKSWYRHLNKFVPESIFWIHRPGRKIVQKSQKIVKKSSKKSREINEKLFKSIRKIS